MKARELARHAALLAEHAIVAQPGLNEELAATAVAGTQLARQAGELRYAGVTGVWYGKTPGLDRASDALRHANLIGTDPQGGALALAGDDPAAKSSTFPAHPNSHSPTSACRPLRRPTPPRSSGTDSMPWNCPGPAACGPP